MTLKIELKLSHHRNCKDARSGSIAQHQELADQVAAAWVVEVEEVIHEHQPLSCNSTSSFISSTSHMNRSTRQTKLIATF